MLKRKLWAACPPVEGVMTSRTQRNVAIAKGHAQFPQQMRFISLGSNVICISSKDDQVVLLASF